MEARQHDIRRDVDEADPATRQEDTADMASQCRGILFWHRGPVVTEETDAARGEREKAATEVGEPCRSGSMPRVHKGELSSPQAEIDLGRGLRVGIAQRPGGGEFENR